MRCFAILLAIFTLLATGCRQDPYMEAYIDTLNLEKLALEDRLYEIEYDYDRMLEELRKCECGKPSASLRQQSDAPTSRAEPFERDERDPDDAPGDDTSDDPPRIEFNDDSSSDPPRVEFDDDSPTPMDFGPGPRSGDDAPVPPFQFESTDPSTSPSASHPLQGPELSRRLDARVSSIRLDRDNTGPVGNRRGVPPEFLRVVVQPRDASDRFLPVVGRLSIVAFDAKTKARVARWDMTAADVRELLSSSVPHGIDVRVPWPKDAADSQQLHVFARLTTSDGRNLESDHVVQVAAESPSSEKWTARSLGRERDIRTATTPLAAPPKRATGRAVEGRQPVAREAAKAPTKPRTTKRPAPTPRRKPTKPEWQPYR